MDGMFGNSGSMSSILPLLLLCGGGCGDSCGGERGHDGCGGMDGLWPILLLCLCGGFGGGGCGGDSCSCGKC